MKRRYRFKFMGCGLIIPVLLLTLGARVHADESHENPFLKKGSRLAIVGDSITEQKLYSKFIETYLTACRPELEIDVIQLGWSGEKAPGFEARMENDLLPWKPDVVTLCYGMNDGLYRPFDRGIGRVYGTSLRRIVEHLIDKRMKVVVGSPGVVDTHTFRYLSPQIYNQNLAQLSSIARTIAKEYKMPFADVNGTMLLAMQKAKKEYGDAYHVAGADGVHPWINGQLLMAFTFLKALGLDGNLGEISIDWTGEANASAGHEVLSARQGTVEILSNRYPFCITGKERDPAGMASILPFIPFHEDLNRFRLVITNLPASSSKVKVQWGSSQRTFGKDELSSGINLAEAFPVNPFCDAFENLMGEIGKKQAYETTMIKGIVTHFRTLKREFAGDTEIHSAVTAIRGRLAARHEQHRQSVHEAVRPVRHTIEISVQ